MDAASASVLAPELYDALGLVGVEIAESVHDLHLARHRVRNETAGHAVVHLDRKPQEAEEPARLLAIGIPDAQRLPLTAPMHDDANVTDTEFVGLRGAVVDESSRRRHRLAIQRHQRSRLWLEANGVTFENELAQHRRCRLRQDDLVRRSASR